MLLKINKLLLQSSGTDLTPAVQEMYINIDMIQTIRAYPKVKEYLRSHGDFATNEYSLIEYGNQEKEEIIVQGTPEEILTKRVTAKVLYG